MFAMHCINGIEGGRPCSWLKCVIDRPTFLAVVFVGPFGVFGLGLSLGVAYVVSALVGIAVLRRKYATDLGLSAITRETTTLGLAAIAAGLCTWGVMSALNANSWTGNSGILGAVAMSILLLGLYGGFASALKVNLRAVLTLGG